MRSIGRSGMPGFVLVACAASLLLSACNDRPTNNGGSGDSPGDNDGGATGGAGDDAAMPDDTTSGDDGGAADVPDAPAESPTDMGSDGSVCGNGVLETGESCDDGNAADGDGCSSMCHLEPGYTCATPGGKCTYIGLCGDGKLMVTIGEQCDDGNQAGGDGCSSQCIIETDFVCPTPGQPCVSTVRCGDHRLGGTEACDDGNTVSGDGCSATCQIEAGWTCVAGGVCRAARCGDGIKVGLEQCDDGNAVGGDGCSASCLVELPGPTEGDGWVCPTPGQPCVRTVCGNGVREGSEQCDDGNNNTGDGCSPFCRNEPICPAAGGACASACGDGLLLAVDIANGQECDDGNTVSGDGCSADCKIEKGYTCGRVLDTPNPFRLPIVLRDFKAFTELNNGGHPDFEHVNQGDVGIVMNVLGTDGKPVHVAGQTPTTINNKPGPLPGGAGGVDYFAKWYHDDPLNKTVLQFLTFAQLANQSFQYANAAFFPLDGMGWGNYMNTGHNFHFTSEVRYWFEYKGNEELDFTGDDDVWVFINKQLAVNIGGVHAALTGSVILDATNGHGAVCDEVTANCNARRDVNLGLQLGSVYEIVVFQAERHTFASNYRLTLTNFITSHSVCQTTCGDGVVAGAEQCDLGPGLNTGLYGTCNPDCTLPPRCGDAVVQSNEDCDDGVNVATYSGTSKACGPSCRFAPRCGDGKVDGMFGEACDLGAGNEPNPYGMGKCTPLCAAAPYCGDGIVQSQFGEACDGTAGCDQCRMVLVP